VLRRYPKGTIEKPRRTNAEFKIEPILEKEQEELSSNVNVNSSTHHLGSSDVANTHSDRTNPMILIYESDATFIGILSTLLHFNPFGASFEEIVSFLQKIQPGTNPLEIKQLLTKFPKIFKPEGDDGVEQEQKWKFVGYSTNKVEVFFVMHFPLIPFDPISHSPAEHGNEII